MKGSRIVNILAPNHVNKFCSLDYDDVNFKQLGTKHHDVYQIKCGCGCAEFNVFRDDHPTLLLRCNKCENKIIVYELSCYPAAFKLSEELVMTKVKDGEYDLFKVCVLYEYSDDYEGVDDISWCTAWIFNGQNGNFIEILNDETA